MNITLYKTMSANNKLEKILSDEFEMTGTLRDGEFNVVSPVIRFAKNVSAYNYAYIEEFGRYYFIDDVRVANNNVFYAHLRCDVLMTYREGILAMYGELTASTNANPYGEDDIPLDVRHDTTTIAFENPFTSGDYVVIAMNGGKKWLE